MGSAVRTPAVRAFAAVPSPWGSDAWRYDKNAFQAWAHEAVTKKGIQAQRELYGMLAMRFGDTDVDKDGKINAAQFDTLCEDVASLPRRFRPPSGPSSPVDWLGAVCALVL